MSEIKNERLSGEFRRVLSQLITQEIGDDRIEMKVSVIDVEVTKDLDLAKVYVSVMGNDKDKAKAIDALKHAEGFLKSRLAETLSVRKIPNLRFILDDSIEKGDKMQKLFDEIKTDE